MLLAALTQKHALVSWKEACLTYHRYEYNRFGGNEPTFVIRSEPSMLRNWPFVRVCPCRPSTDDPQNPTFPQECL